jgi:predicted RNase H-like HicB family nuclease
MGGLLGTAMSSQNYLIIVHPAEDGGFWTEVPALMGCGSQGETVDEAITMTTDAILGYIESLRKHGEPVPSERNIAVTVTVAA